MGDSDDQTAAMMRELKRIQDEAAGYVANVEASGARGYLDAMARALSTGLPKLDDVIASSTAAGNDLRALVGNVDTPTVAYPPMLPSKTGAEYAIERVEREVSRLASIAAGMADNTSANAAIAKTGLEQSIALVAGLQDLHSTTRQGIDASNSAARAVVRLTAALVVLTLVLMFLTAVLVLRPS